MKRIDDKIKEIEKKDKTNRLVYIGFVALIIAFMAYALSSEKKIKTQSQTIVSQSDTINMTKEQLKDMNDSLIKVVRKLENSLTPEGYWADIEKIGTAKAYINYITANDNSVKIIYRPEALEKIDKSSTAGTTGWLYIGKKSGDELVDGICTVKWRKDVPEVNSNSIPEIGDIVKLKSESRYYYSSYNRAQKGQSQSGSWPLDAKAYILDIKMQGPAIYIKIKF